MDLSLLLFLELVEYEITKEKSAAEWKKMESAFHRAMKRGPSSNLGVDEFEDLAKHEFVRIARKNYLKTGDEANIAELELEFEYLWQNVKNCYRIYY